MLYWSKVFNSIKKNLKLRKLSQILDSSIGFSIEEMMKTSEKKEKALKELYDLCSKDKHLNSILNEHKITFLKYDEIYSQLLRAGAGQWAKGHYVAASSLVFGSTLRFILENKDKMDISDLAYSLIDYFENNRTGQVKEI